jgi:7-carboxy-7-deazaguanine synthase
MTLKVSEIFYSIQGESLRAGYPCVFVRLAGCNLRCTYCDTAYALHGGTQRSIEEILKDVKQYRCSLVEVTGGEPLLQDETPELITKLAETGYNVLLETNGTITLSGLDKRCIKVVDVKCPSSGEDKKFNSAVLEGLSEQDELKFVISDRFDYEFACSFLKLHANIAVASVHFSPVMSRLAASELAAWILEDGLSVRCAPQLHRFIWPDIEHGV